MGTDFVSPDKRITGNHFRSGQYWSERPDESAADGGWTWVAALLVAALFIVSGYLDQEAGMTHASSTSNTAQPYASNSSAIPTSTTSIASNDKGY